MVTFLEALYLITTISAVITLVLVWRERRSTRRATVRLAARHWAGITVALAILCVALYWYLGPR